MTIELVRQGNYGKAMKRKSSLRLAPFTEHTHRKLTDLHPPGKGIITSIPTAEHENELAAFNPDLIGTINKYLHLSSVN
ncbi:hypothetical protein GJ496_006603 [Pomphorhynchus laevis]|nr:hypothetical protein GJ496_006603 [Pomphorhynchus laevis]